MINIFQLHKGFHSIGLIFLPYSSAEISQNFFTQSKYIKDKISGVTLDLITGIKIASKHPIFSDKKCYMSGTHVSKQDNLSCTLSLSTICGKSFYTFTQQTITWEHTRRWLPLFTFTLKSGDTWSFYLSKVFLKNIKGTYMMQLLLNCFLSWIRFFSNTGLNKFNICMHWFLYS